jgi:hypothetical protein
MDESRDKSGNYMLLVVPRLAAWRLKCLKHNIWYAKPFLIAFNPQNQTENTAGGERSF